MESGDRRNRHQGGVSGCSTRAPDAAQRVALAERCAAEPGPYRTPVFGTVPALRSGMKNAAPRPGHEPLASSLPGLTRQSICFERLLKKMDTRVKPAYDEL
jgi:hypothetical protein